MSVDTKKNRAPFFTMRKFYVSIILCSTLFGCNFIAKKTIRSQIPSGFEVSDLRYFQSDIDCVLAIYNIETVDFDRIEDGNFSIIQYDNNNNFEQNFIGITLLSGKACTTSDNRDEFMEVHGSSDVLLMANNSQNAVIAFHPSTQTLYFSGRD